MNGYIHQRKNMSGTIDVQCHKFDCDYGTLHVDHVNNRVGVGTKTPSTKLDVVGGIAVSGGANITGNTSISGNTIISGNTNFDANTLFIDSVNNRVGVGTASPSATLEVTGDAKVSGNVAIDTNTLVVDSVNNRVGICTTNPANPLEITGTCYINSGDLSFNSGSQNIRWGGSIVYGRYSIGGGVTSSSLTSVGTLTSLAVSGSANLSSIIATHSSSAGHSIGATNILSGANNSYNNAIGTYQRMFGWTTAGASHTITISNYAFHASNDNFACTMRIYASNKANTTPKVGILTCDILKEYGANVAVTTISTTKNANLTAFSVAGSTNDLVVTTDSDCLVSWSIIGSI